jgi:hypothetical protein
MTENVVDCLKPSPDNSENFFEVFNEKDYFTLFIFSLEFSELRL